MNKELTKEERIQINIQRMMGIFAKNDRPMNLGKHLFNIYKFIPQLREISKTLDINCIHTIPFHKLGIKRKSMYCEIIDEYEGVILEYKDGWNATFHYGSKHQKIITL